jgi:hypothetical protein
MPKAIQCCCNIQKYAAVYFAASWNLLVEVGVSLGINLDKLQRARKVDNEFIG